MVKENEMHLFMSPFFATNGHGSYKFGRICPNQDAEDKKRGKVAAPIKFSEVCSAPKTGESAQRQINDEVFAGAILPLEGIFGIKNHSVSRYFDQEADSEKLEAMKIQLANETNEKIKSVRIATVLNRIFKIH